MSTTMLMVNNPLQPGPQQGKQQHPPPPPTHPTNSPIRHNQFNQQFQQPPVPQVSPLMAPPQESNPQVPPPYFHHYPPTNSPSVDTNESMLARVFHRQIDMAQRQEKHDQEREEREKHQEECEKHKKREANQRAHINKTFEKIEHFYGSNSNRCLPWLEQIHMMSNQYNRDFCEELLLNSGGIITKTIHNINVDATPEQIKDIILCNHSNLKTPSIGFMLSILSNRNQTKPCKHTTAGGIHIFDWHTQASQSMMLDPGHSVSNMPVHCMANKVTRWKAGLTKTYLNLYRQLLKKQQISSPAFSPSKPSVQGG